MSSPAKSAVADDVRQHIISSILSKRGPDGQPEETLISFIKVYEQEEGGSGYKSRYLILAVSKLGKVVIHKAKRNSNLSFSKGKTWHLEDMRGLEVIGPTDFALTMTIRRYHWQTEQARDQSHFLNAVVKVYRSYTKNEIPELIGWTPPPSSSAGSSSGGADQRRPSTSSSNMLAPHVQNLDLVPPGAIKTSRSGSSSSLASGNSSRYEGASEASFSRTRSRPSMDESRNAASPFGRSPLSEGLSPRRPSAHDPSIGAGLGAPIGLGAPSSAPRFSGEMARLPSAASEYGYPAAGVTSGSRRPSEMSTNGNGSGLRTAEADANRMSMEVVNSAPDTPRAPDRGATTQTTPRAVPVKSPERSAARQAASTSAGPPVSAAAAAANGADAAPAPASAIPSSTTQRLQLPKITTTGASPTVPTDEHVPAVTPFDRQRPRRNTYYPAPVDTTFSREVLLTSKNGLLPGAAGLTIEADQDAAENALLENVEQLLEGFDWTAGVAGGVKKGTADATESRLLDELAALNSANIHAFLESDDRIAQVLGHIDEAINELDDIDLQITGYKMQLNAVSEDISFIESQNRGLQVQTSNQHALLDELRQLLQIVEVPRDDLAVLAQESPGSQRGVENLERAAASLYKALLAGMDQANAEVAATIARMQEYKENSAQFSKRLHDYLDVQFKSQSDQTLSKSRQAGKQSLELTPHSEMCESLMTYEGLVLYVKEMDEDRYQRLCSNYMSTISSLHQNQMKDLLMNLMGTVNTVVGGEPNEASFATAVHTVPKASALAKSRAAVGLRGDKPDTTRKERKGGDDNAHRVSELYQNALTQIINQAITEEAFIGAFLHLNDAESTFADHMRLDSYFRRQAARQAARQLSPGLAQLVRSMMDLVFGFIDQELKNWTEAAVERNPIAIVGVLGVTERFAKEAEAESPSIFFTGLFDRQLARQRAGVDAFINEQVRTIEHARSSSRRHRGVAFFVRHFPDLLGAYWTKTFVEKMEAQLVDAESLDVRSRIDGAYDRIVNTIFNTTQQIAKMDRGEALAAEDKGQINYYVVMIENLYHFVEDLSRLSVPALAVFHERARAMYEENLQAYVKMIMRRSFGRMMDFFDGVERLMQSTPAAEVSLHSSYSRSALKKVLKENGAKDMRKGVETMARRVDKHFGDDDAAGGLSSADAGAASSSQVVIQQVWKEVTAAMRQETERARGIIVNSYRDTGLGLEYSPQDVESACRRAK